MNQEKSQNRIQSDEFQRDPRNLVFMCGGADDECQVVLRLCIDVRTYGC